jgi:hypothetical protein
MQYLLLIYGAESHEKDMSEADQAELFTAYGAYSAEVKEKGLLLGGEALQPTATATTVRVREGKTLTTDGPFAETKEQLGGFYFLECEDLDQALEYAAKIPSAKYGSVEVRPVMKFDNV